MRKEKEAEKEVPFEVKRKSIKNIFNMLTVRCMQRYVCNDINKQNQNKGDLGEYTGLGTMAKSRHVKSY